MKKYVLLLLALSAFGQPLVATCRTGMSQKAPAVTFSFNSINESEYMLIVHNENRFPISIIPPVPAKSVFTLRCLDASPSSTGRVGTAGTFDFSRGQRRSLKRVIIKANAIHSFSIPGYLPFFESRFCLYFPDAARLGKEKSVTSGGVTYVLFTKAHPTEPKTVRIANPGLTLTRSSRRL